MGMLNVAHKVIMYSKMNIFFIAAAHIKLLKILVKLITFFLFIIKKIDYLKFIEVEFFILVCNFSWDE